ncbi:MAG TPA: thiamine pyrophosphate-dependent enzyme [Devosia sp.]|nr:thiamine pyrophosphate-dependent enzyme [Devosia sp.]
MSDRLPSLDRASAVPAIIREPEDFLIISGLAGAARDVAALTNDGDNAFIMAGAMGAAVMMGFGLALAQPKRRILVVTGDGELLMNVGALATVGIANPANLSILCIDNGHYGETGFQKSHTSHGVDLEKIAIGAAIRTTRTVWAESEIPDAARLLREANSSAFVLLKVTAADAPKYSRSMDAALSRMRFKRALAAQN